MDTVRRKHAWGERIYYIVTDAKSKDGMILTRDFNGKWDREYYWKIQIFAPMKRLLQIVYPFFRWEAFEQNYYQNSLF